MINLDDLPNKIKNKVEIDGNGCWLWTGGKNGKGYAYVYFEGKMWRVHRLVYELVYGIPENLLVCHKCDVPHCINPNHLFAGTQSDNIRDRDNKGRDNYAIGERHGHSKLSSKDVIRMKALVIEGNYTQREVAKMFNVDYRHLNSIIRGRIWGHVN